MRSIRFGTCQGSSSLPTMNANSQLTSTINRVIQRLSYLHPPGKNIFAVSLLALSIWCGTGPLFSQSTADSTIKDDLAKRSPDIHWPAGFSPGDAALFAHNEVFIKAPCATVWQHLAAAQDWPAWYPECSRCKDCEQPCRSPPTRQHFRVEHIRVTHHELCSRIRS
jgi:hypothetical protein